MCQKNDYYHKDTQWSTGYGPQWLDVTASDPTIKTSRFLVKALSHAAGAVAMRTRLTCKDRCAVSGVAASVATVDTVDTATTSDLPTEHGTETVDAHPMRPSSPTSTGLLKIAAEMLSADGDNKISEAPDQARPPCATVLMVSPVMTRTSLRPVLKSNLKVEISAEQATSSCCSIFMQHHHQDTLDLKSLDASPFLIDELRKETSVPSATAGRTLKRKDVLIWHFCIQG